MYEEASGSVWSYQKRHQPDKLGSLSNERSVWNGVHYSNDKQAGR